MSKLFLLALVAFAFIALGVEVESGEVPAGGSCKVDEDCSEGLTCQKWKRRMSICRPEKCVEENEPCGKSNGSCCKGMKCSFKANENGIGFSRRCLTRKSTFMQSKP